MDFSKELLDAVTTELNKVPAAKPNDLGLDILHIRDRVVEDTSLDKELVLEAIKAVAAERGISLLL